MGKDKENKTIKLSIYFWTNIGKKEEIKGLKMPKKICWDSGFVSVVSNNLHGIRSGVRKDFRDLSDIPEAINDVLKRSAIKVISSAKHKEFKEALKKMNESLLINIDS